MRPGQSIELHCNMPNTGSRLNVVLPGLGKSIAFGGMSSALELTAHLSQHYGACRFISLFEDGTGSADEFAYLSEYAAQPELFFLGTGQALPCHEKDVFLLTYWQGFSLWEELHQARLRNNLPALPFYYLIQDYEPCFAGFGQKHALALKSYSFGDLTTAIINSEELAAYLRKTGASFAREYAFKPSMNSDLSVYLQQTGFRLPPKDTGETVILFYGRPGVLRNCFEAGVDALRLFFEGLPEAGRKRFSALSVGLPHEDILLAENAVLKSLGRLPIEQYIALLLKAHVGLSLMISPHPSYPPMEMALFGLPTVTTDYGGKNMGAGHPLLFAAQWPEAAELCGLLRKAVAEAEKLKGTPQRAVPPASLSRLPWRENFAALGIEPILP